MRRALVRSAKTLVALQAAGCFAAHAQDAQSASQAPAVTELDQVTVVGTRTPRTVRETAGTITIIDQKQIEQNQVETIQDLVRYEPDLSVSTDAVRFGANGFTIRGIGGNRVLELIDGIPVSDTFSIGDFSDAGRNFVDPELIKRVEILRGAASAVYGSDAIGGVVSFTTKDPQDYLEDGKSWSVSTKASYNTVDSTNSESVLGAFGTAANALELVYGRRDGYQSENHGSVGGSGFDRTQPNPQDYYQNNFLAKVVFNWEKSTYRLQFSGTQGGAKTDVLSDIGSRDYSADLGLPSGSGLYVYDTHAETGNDMQRALRLNGSAELRGGSWYDQAIVRFYGETSKTDQATDQNQDQDIAVVPMPLLIMRDFRFRQDVGGVNANLHSAFRTGGLHHVLAYGLDFRLVRTSELRDGEQTNTLTGQSSKDVTPDTFPTRDFPPSLTYQGGAYLQDEIRYQSLTVISGARYDYYKLHPKQDATYDDANPDSPVAGLTHSSTSPKLGLLYDLSRHWTAYAQYAHGFRAPPYDDVNVGFTNLTFDYTAIPNPGLKPEKSDGVETGLRFGTGGASLSSAVYYSRYRDFIEPFVNLGTNPSTGLDTFQAQNFSAVRIYGAELIGSYSLDFLPGLNLHAALNYTRGDNLQDHAPLNSIDPAKGIVGIECANPDHRWDGQVIVTAALHQKRVDNTGGGADSGGSYGANGSGALFQSPGYAKLDLLGWFEPSPGIRLSLGVFNVTNQKYWDWSAVQGQFANNPAIDLYTSAGFNMRFSARFSF